MNHVPDPRIEYQRLEFLGDRVLNLIISENFYRAFLEKDAGNLTNLMRSLSNDNLDIMLEKLENKFLDEILAFKIQYRSDSEDLYADDLESFIGNYYLIRGLSETQKMIERHLSGEIGNFNPNTDYISQLQVYTQKMLNPIPEYPLINDKTLPDNRHEFHVQVKIAGEILGEGYGKRKSIAKQHAAKRALERLGLLPKN
jgi:ribonuclease-3